MAASTIGDQVLSPIERVIPLLEQPIVFVAAAFFIGFVIVLFYLLREKDRFRKAVLEVSAAADKRIDAVQEGRAKEINDLRNSHAIELAGLHAEARDMVQRQTEAMLTLMRVSQDLEAISRLVRDMRERRGKKDREPDNEK